MCAGIHICECVNVCINTHLYVAVCTPVQGTAITTQIGPEVLQYANSKAS